MSLALDSSLIERLDAARARDEVLLYKQHTYGFVPADAGRLLDVGSGTGDDALTLSERLGPDTEVVGVESHTELVEEARRRARNVALNARFLEGDLLALPFSDAAFDVVRADALFSRGLDAVALLRELFRVLSPHGTLLIHECALPSDVSSVPTQPLAVRAGALCDLIRATLEHPCIEVHALGADASAPRDSRMLQRDENPLMRGGFTLLVTKT